MDSYHDFGKRVDIIGTLTTKLPGQRQSTLLQVVYTANAHTIWCEQADNLPLCYFLKLNFGVVRKFTRKLS